MKIGDTLRIKWDADGDDYIGVFIRRERGFLVLVDSCGEQFVCRPDSLVALEVVTKSTGSK